MHGPAMPLELRLTLAVAVIIVAIAAYIAVDGQTLVLRLFDWLALIGWWAVVLFLVVDMLVVILLLPGVMLTMGAGFLFGVAEGTVYVVAATSAGASIAFIVARHWLGEHSVQYLRTHPRLNLIERGLAREGWKLVLLTRLIPFFPFKLSNYFFGVTRMSFPHFFVGTVIGIVPFTLTNTYLGSIVADLATLGAVTSPQSWLDWLVYGAGFIVTIGAVIYISRLARRALAEEQFDHAHQPPDRGS